MPTATTVPVKKSKQALKFYQENGPKFGAILKDLYKNFSENNYCYDIDGYFRDVAPRCFLKHDYFKKIRFPFASASNYLGESFGRSLCLSPNDVVAHGNPNLSGYKEGDLLSVDCGIGLPFGDRHLNFDSAFTLEVGSREQPDWLLSPHRALKNIVKQQPKNTGEIAEIIRATAANDNLKQVVALTGHGIGYALHEAPIIHNAPGDFKSVGLFEGMCFCVEPIFVKPKEENFKSFISPICIGSDGWEISTVSGESSSHFETVFGVIDGRIIDLVGVTEWDL